MVNIQKLIVISVLLLSSSVAHTANESDGLPVADSAARQDAPDFASEKLSGEKIALADYSGKVVLLNFWATWCMPCREEMPGMEALWQKYRDQGLVILAVSVDEGSAGRIETFIRMFDLSFPVLRDPEGIVSDLYQASSMPTSFLIDRNGKLVSRIVGTEDWYSPAAVKMVEVLLAE